MIMNSKDYIYIFINHLEIQRMSTKYNDYIYIYVYIYIYIYT